MKDDKKIEKTSRFKVEQNCKFWINTNFKPVINSSLFVIKITILVDDNGRGYFIYKWIQLFLNSRYSEAEAGF
jgi:hypothetical protein